MALFKNGSSHLTLCYKKGPSIKRVIEVLKDAPPINILGKDDFSNVGYENVNQLPESEFVTIDDVICFTEVYTEKAFPMKLVRKKVEEIRVTHEDYIGMKKVEFNRNYRDEIEHEILKELSPTCSTRTTRTDILLDLKEKRIYIEARGVSKNYLSIHRFQSIFEIEDIYIKSRFSQKIQKNVSHNILSEFFIYWLYTKTLNSDFKDNLKMSSNLQVKDHNTNISISGDIDSFLTIYKKLKTGRKVDSVSLSLPHPDFERCDKYSFSLSRKDLTIKKFSHFDFGGRGEVSVSTMLEKLYSLKDIDLYVDKLAHSFEKEIEGSRLGDLFVELRGLKVEE